MPKYYDFAYLNDTLKVPDYMLGYVLDTPKLLTYERVEDFLLLFEMMVAEVAPTSDLEWLLSIDLAWIMWDIRRFRRWKSALVNTKKRHAVVEALRRTERESFAQQPDDECIRKQMIKKLDDSYGDEKKKQAIADQLKERGFVSCAYDAVAFIESAADLATIEKFLVSAVDQFNKTLREAAVRREFKLRAEKARKELELMQLAHNMRAEKKEAG